MKDNWLNRTEILIGKKNIDKLQNSHILLFGLGGVGSYIAEALVRAGIGTITIVDKDIVDITNINRQLIADINSIGKYKVDIEKKRLLQINPKLNIFTVKEFVSKNNINNIISNDILYIIDAIDTISSKIDIIEYSYKNCIPIISCMGTGNRLDATKFEITDIYKTSVCPLAKIIRKKLKKLGIPYLKVLYSKENPIKTNINTIASISYVPSIAGLLIAGEVIRDLIK